MIYIYIYMCMLKKEVAKNNFIEGWKIEMIIKEDSVIKIIDSGEEVAGEIKAYEDIVIEGNGKGYTFLLRNTRCNENCIFESEKIYMKDNKYIVDGYFKDAILVVEDRKEKTMHESYMDYNN